MSGERRSPVRGAGAGVVPWSREFRLGFAALLLGATGIAFAPVFVRWSEVGPSATAGYRLILALPVFWVWVLWERRSGRGSGVRFGEMSGGMALCGFLFAADLALWHWSIRWTTVANATLFANFAPLVVTIGARFLFGEAIRRRFVGALLMAMAGAFLILGVSVRLEPDRLAGDGLGLLTAVFYGLYMLAGKRLRERHSTAAVMAGSGLVAGPLLFLVAGASGEVLVPATGQGWACLAGLALVSQIGGQTLIIHAFRHLPAGFSSLSLLLQPAIAAALGWVLFGEALGPVQLLGAAVLLAGIFRGRPGAGSRRGGEGS